MVRPNLNVSSTTNAVSASNATPVANASNAHNDVPNLQQSSQNAPLEGADSSEISRATSPIVSSTTMPAMVTFTAAASQSDVIPQIAQTQGFSFLNFAMNYGNLFYFPKSQLQCYGESVYSTTSNSNLLSKCNNEPSPLERFTSVVAWSISTTRPTSFGVAPYNPILGETHHVSKGNLNVLLEQVSTNPPVSALHATDDKENIEMIWCQKAVPKFCGTSIEAEVHGKRVLKLKNHGETYEMNCPRLSIRILPVPGVSWVGNVNIRCKETGLVAELSYESSYSFLGLGGNSKLIKGKILDSSSLTALYEIDGQWDRTVKVKDTNSGKVKVIYDAKEVISGLKAPIVKDAEGVWQTESALIWGELTQAIISNDWEKAKEAKQGVEERQSKMSRERDTRGERWTPKNFLVCYSNESGLDCDCSPISKWVPAAPIIAP